MTSEETLPADELGSPEIVETPVPATGSGPVVRSGVDRRTFSWKTVFYSLLRPRRKRVNRVEDHLDHQVDFHPVSTPLLCVGVIVLAAVDAGMTLYFYDVGVGQINWLVTATIEAGGRSFYIAAKLIGTGLCVLLLATTSKIRVFGKLQAHHFLFFVFFFYLAATLNMLRYFL